MKYLRLALGFLTILPMPDEDQVEVSDLGRAAGWYPLVGAFIGAFVGLAKWGGDIIFPPLVSALMATAFWAILTGGLHLDGLADSCDGLLSAAAPERRLEIMKDSRLGTFGGTGLVLQLMLKTLLLASFTGWKIILIASLAASLGRWIILLSVRRPQARTGGLGAAFSEGVSSKAVFIASIIPLVLAIAGGLRGIIAVAAVLLALSYIMEVSRKKLGGVTGDVFGLAVEIAETVVLLVFTAVWPFQ